jgi:cold shock protein
MKTGTVKFFNEAKGFGFIQEDNGSEIFVHISGLKCDIRENDKVTFDTAEGRRGLNAVNVKLV